MRRFIRSGLPQILLIGFGQLCLLVVGSRAEAEDIGQWFAGFSQPVHITAIAVDPLNETRIFAGGAGEKPLYRTTDGGRTWATVGTGLPSLGALSCFAFDAGSPDRIYVGSFVSGVFRSTDGGQTWTAVNQGLGSAGRLPEVLALATDPEQPGVVYAGLRGGLTGPDPFPSSVYHGGIYKSTDGGDTWHSSGTGIPLLESTPLSVGALLVDPKNPKHLYAGARELYRSTDWGTTWTSLPSKPPGFPKGEIVAIQNDPRDSRVLYLAKGKGSYESTDGIYKTTDAGETWIAASRGLPKPIISSLILDPENPDVLYTAAGESLYAATGQSGIYRSDNGAASWNSFEPSLPSVYTTYALVLTGESNSRRLHAATAAGVVSAGICSSSVFYLPHFGDGLSGGLRLRTNLMLTNLGPEAPVVVDFFTPDGNPLMLQFGARELSNSLTVDLKPGEVFSEWTPGVGSLAFGYARVSAPADVKGNVIFSCEQDEQVLYETGVPAVTLPTRNFTLFFDCHDERSNVGLAVVNRGAGSASVRFRLYDHDFGLIAEHTLAEVLGRNLNSGQSFARYATEIFPEIRQKGLQTGTITVLSDQDLAAIALHEQGTSGAVRMSTFPVIPARADQEKAGFLYQGVLSFPQMADGQLDDVTFRTELVLVNTGPDTSAEIFFRGGLGSPVEFELEGLGPKSSISLDLPAGRAVSLKTKGTGALHTGYATILPYGIGVHGFVVVVQSDAVSSTEATVMASREQVKFSFCFDASDPSVNTGFAIAGKGDPSVLTHVECKLYDPSAQLIATRKFDFMPEGHSAQFATELFPEIRSANTPTGLIAVESSAPLVPLVLREHLASAPSFPKPLYRLTTLPVFAKGID